MSFRVGAPWISGAFLVGNQGGGVLAENLAATGDNGAGFLFDDVSLPADNGKEIRGLITFIPAGLTLQTFEDGGAVASAADGTYVATYQLYVDYVPTGSPANISFTFGAGNATATGATLTSTSSIAGGSAAGASPGTATGATLTSTSSISGGTATGASNASAAGATLTGAATIAGGSATGNLNATASGASLTATSSIFGGVAIDGAPFISQVLQFTVKTENRTYTVSPDARA